MNSLVIPPSPNWYETAILACAPDNTVIYGARNEIVIINHSPQDQTADVKIIPRAHSQKITSVSINKNWGQPHKLIVTSSEDKIIKLWNVETLEIKFSHNGHKVHGKIIAATFAGDERVISVSEEGAIIVWNVSLNEINLLKDIFGFKVTVTCISTCPHASWLTAFGLKNGLVVVTDLRKQGKILYKLRGHDKSVLSLAWCPAPVNIFPKDPNNYVGAKKVSDESSTEINEANSTSKCDASDEDRNKSEVKISKRDVWMNLTHADDDDLPEECEKEYRTDRLLRLFHSGDYDFLKECSNLKKQILGSDVTDISCSAVAPEVNKDRPVLKAKKSLNKQSQRSENSRELDGEKISNVLDENYQVQQVIATETNVVNVEVEREDELGVTEMVQLENFDDQEENNQVLNYIASKTKFEGFDVKKDEIDTVVRTNHANDEMKENTDGLEESNHILDAFIVEIKLEKNTVATSGQALNETTTEKAEIVPIKKEEKNDASKELEDVADRPVESYKNQQFDDPPGHSQTVETLHIGLQESEQPLEVTAVKTEAKDLKKVEKEMEEDIDQSNDTEVDKNDKSRTNDPYVVCNIVDNILNELEKSVEVGTHSDIYETLQMKNSNMNSFNKSKHSVGVDQKNVEDASAVGGPTVEFTEILQIEDSNVNPFNKTKDSVDVDQKSIEDASEVEGQTVAFTETLHLEDSNVNSFNESKDSVDVDQKSVEDATAVEGQNVGVTEENEEKVLAKVPVEEEPRKEFLLASSAREGNIYIWRAGTDGRMQTFLAVPNKPNHRRGPKSNADKTWIILCWVTPTSLLSSSKSGELVQWILPKSKDKRKQFRTVHKDHKSLLFNIAAPIVLLNEYNWLDEKLQNVWTIGQDRLLLNTSLSSERTNLACYPTIGVAECFALSPLDPNRLAVGTGEAIVKIWDLSRPHIKNIIMTNFYQKIQSKVVALAWHPTNELILAYGTLEGRVGCIDTTNKSKSPTLLPNYFKSQIHKIEWGPLNGNKENKGLYVVAEGKLVLFNVKGTEKEPQEVDMPDNTYVYTFAWKPNYETLLVSSKSGALIVYSTDLKIVSTYYLHRKLQSILWHPNAGEADSNMSKYCDWFASISNSKEVIVYDFGKESDNNEEKIVAKYSRQGDIINSIAWSPFEADKLVIAGDDGVAQVWDVESDAVLSTFINPNFESILAIIWSPIDPNYIISAGKDRTIRIWNISDYPVKNDKEVSDLKKKAIKKAASDSSEITENGPQEPPKAKKSHKNNILPNFYSPKTTPQLVADLRRLFLWKEDASNVESLLLGDCKPEILNVFGTHADMFNIVSANEIILKERGKYNLKNTLSLIKGDIGSAIKEAIDEKRVNPWIIMMAPMVSPKLWQTACEVYAQQLSEESDVDPLEVATYFLACHKVEDAINALCEGAMFREAVALAKCRLPENDVIVTNVIEKWASYSVTVGNFETAALCNIFLGKYGDAASVLFRRTDVELLELAVELAEKSGNEELHKAVLFRYNAFKLRNQEDSELPSKVEVVLQKAKLVGNTEGNLNGIETSNGNEEQSIEREPDIAEGGKDGGLEEEKVKSVDQNSEEVKNVKGEEVSALVHTEKLDSDLCRVKITSVNGSSEPPMESDEGTDAETKPEVVGITPHEPLSPC